jgi:hypothetical protein
MAQTEDRHAERIELMPHELVFLPTGLTGKRPIYRYPVENFWSRRAGTGGTMD